MKVQFISLFLCATVSFSVMAQKTVSTDDRIAQGQSKIKESSRESSDNKSQLGALITRKVPFTREMVLGNILKGALDNMHLVKKKINDDLSEDSFKLYVERIDFGKQFLLQSDIDELEKSDEEFDDQLSRGDLKVVEKTAAIFKKRIATIQKYVENRLKKSFDFNKNDSFETDAKKRKFAKSEKVLNKRWDKMLKLDVLTTYLDLKDEKSGVNEKKITNKKKIKKAKKKKDELKNLSDKQLRVKAREKVSKRFNKVFKRLADEKKSDIADKFYNAIARVYDPHTHYFAPEEKEEFDIDMSGKLEGIGALLREEGSFIKVERIIPGSASWKGKELKAEDVILAVGQGDEEAVDIVEMSLRDAVKLIRGKKGTTVKLTVKRPDGTKLVIGIVRDEVVIEESYVKGSMIEHKDLGLKIGYIHVPKFYRDFADPKGRNCSTDVKNELVKLKKQNVQGVILDLRNNGGGALRDATLMSGLFIKKGPIVQVKAHTGATEVLTDVDPKIEFKKPLIVLVNRFSASASEIVAAALQDYGRAVIVGTSKQTHGKGTVQAVVDLDGYVHSPAKIYSPIGALKITIQMFYRITGGSTQFKGVTPDITLPDQFEYIESGERTLDFAIPYAKVQEVDFKPWTSAKYKLNNLIGKSEKRVSKSKKFQKIRDSIKWYKDRKDQSERTLNLTKMKKFRTESKEKAELFKNEEKIETLKVTVLRKVRDEVDKENADEFKKTINTDPVIEEVMYIFQDMIKKS